MVRNGYILVILITAIILGGALLGASGESKELQKAILLSQEALISQQEEEGYWFSYVETNTLYNSLQIVLYFYLHKEVEERETIEGLCRYLVSTQTEDGSWPFYDGGSPDMGLTALNYFALKLAGYRQDEPPMALARNYVLSHGGAESIYGTYMVILALFDQFQFPPLPTLPISSLLCIAPKLSWLRMMVIPFMVVLRENAFFYPPEEAYITELFLDQSKGKIIPRDGKIILAITALIEEARKELKVAPSTSYQSSRCAYRSYISWLLARQNTSNGLFYDYLPNTFFPLLSLKVLEDIVNNEEAIDNALEGLHSFQHNLPEGIYQPPTDGAIPATFSALMALSETSLTLDGPVIKKGVDFLWSRQHKRYGDWVYQMMIPVRPGGWGFTLASESFPDIDDTATTLLILRTIYGDNWHERKKDFKRGIRWLLAMQNWNGGWGTWDREAVFFTPVLREFFPTVVMNESVVDHTTRVLIALSLFGYTETANPRISRAVNWIKEQRLEDGSWAGTWFVDYIYQTANVLGALSLVKAEMNGDFIQKSLHYILEKQREDGGWGEDPSSFAVGRYVPLGYSSPSQTALILYGLFNFLRGGEYHSIDQLKDPINKAIHFILSTQGEDGLWKDPAYIGAVFPQVQYVRYPIFQESCILGVLGMYSQDIDHFQDS